MKFGDVEVKGKTFEVEIGTDGYFGVIDSGDYIKAVSLPELQAKLAKRMARKDLKVSIPFVRWEKKDTWRNKEPGKLLVGHITGMHAGNGNVMVQFEGQKVEQDRWNSDDYFNPDYAAEIQKTGEELERAQEAFDAVRDKARFNGKNAIRAALGKDAVEVGE